MQTLDEPIQTIVFEGTMAVDKRHANTVNPILKMVDFLAKAELPHSDKTNRVMTGLAEDIGSGLIEFATNRDITCPMVASPQFQPDGGRAIVWLPENFMDVLTDGLADPTQQIAALIYSISFTREIIHGGYTPNTHDRAQDRSDSFIQLAKKNPDLITKTIAAAGLGSAYNQTW